MLEVDPRTLLREKHQMDPISAIVGALVAGASVAATEVASKAVKDAYEGLTA